MVDMTRKRYVHNVTGVETTLSAKFAAIFGDRFTLIEDEVPEVAQPADAPAPATVEKPKRTRKTNTEDNSVGDDVNASAPNTDSSEEGN